MTTYSTDTPNGWMPGVARVRIPDTNFAHGCSTRLAVVRHIIVGTLASAVSKFQNPASIVSAHFGVGRDGTIKQFVSVYDTAYANGLSWSNVNGCWVDPEGNLLKAPHPSPAWPLLKPPINPNWQTLAIEAEGRPEDTPTAAQTAATVAILRWAGVLFPSLMPYMPLRSLIGHCHISPVERAGCPGPNFDYAAVAAAANTATPPQAYLVRGVPLYVDSQLTQLSNSWLVPGQKVTVDRVHADQPQDYAPSAAHRVDAEGGLFFDLNGAVRV